jgi:uncharacterized surface protein with fasciclin (FAS1) repeats
MNKLLKTLLIQLITLLALTACQQDTVERFATFEDYTVISYLESELERYSEFVKMIRLAGIYDLLGAYGTYTCFVPVNEAVTAYFARLGIDMQSLEESKLRKLVFNHIIATRIVRSENFPNGRITVPNMAESFTLLNFSMGSGSVYVNKSALILARDIDVHNGVVHVVSEVLEPSEIFLNEAIAADKRFGLFTQALELTGLADSLHRLDDPDYVSQPVVSAIYGNTWNTPALHKYGYTAFVVSDSTFSEVYGVNSIEDLKDFARKTYDVMYPADANETDPTKRNNSLNRFIGYHLLNRSQASNEFITDDLQYYFIPDYRICEYIEPICLNTLIEVQLGQSEDVGNVIFNRLNDGTASRIISPDNQCENGIYHEIDRPLLYSRRVENETLNKRIRIDAISCMPELITNKIRGNYEWYILPQGYTTAYTSTSASQAHYKRDRSYRALYGDEIILGGKYDFTLRLPAIPPGRYEVRLGFSYAGGRGVAQVFFDGEPCGIPIDMTITGRDPRIGWVADSETEDNGVENDKMMHNRGWMKGPASNLVLQRSISARDYYECLRRVLTTRTFDSATPHYLRIKSVEERGDRELQVDYVDFVPSSVLDREDRY